MDPNIKIVSRSITNLMLVGVLLALVGGLVLFARPLAGESVKVDAVTAWSGAFFLVGVFILCLRYGVILDRQQRTSTHWRGLLIPFHRSREHSFSKACYVSMASRSKIDPAKATHLDDAVGPLLEGYLNDGFSVKLEDTGSAAIALKELKDYDAARRFAEDVAKFLDVGLRDRSSTVEVVREAGKLDEPLRERLKSIGQSVPLPPQIEDARATISYGGIGASTSIDLPPAGINARSALKAALAVGSVPLLYMMESGKSTKGMDADSLLLLLAALFAVGLILVLNLLHRATANSEQIVISPGEFVIARHNSSGTETTRLAIAEIEEIALVALRVPRSFHDSMSRVVIRRDRGSIELGATLLKGEEVRWLRDVLIHLLNPASRETELS